MGGGFSLPPPSPFFGGNMRNALGDCIRMLSSSIRTGEPFNVEDTREYKSLNDKNKKFVDHLILNTYRHTLLESYDHILLDDKEEDSRSGDG